jgi:hypothetical protein
MEWEVPESPPRPDINIQSKLGHIGEENKQVTSDYNFSNHKLG